MLKLNRKQRDILDESLSATPDVVSEKLTAKYRRENVTVTKTIEDEAGNKTKKVVLQTVTVKDVYDAKHQLRKQVQNAEEFLAVAKSKYKAHLTRRLNTPKIVPVDEEELEFTKHLKGRD
jgi:hypothetical protein